MKLIRNLGVFGIVAAMLGSAPAGAGPLRVEVEDAADHHVSAQGSFRGGLPSSWEYKLGSRRSAKNITGIAAHGLLAAHRLTGLEMHQQSAVQAARSLVKAYDQGWNKRRPFTQDIEFLAAAGFVIDAARWFNVTRGRYTPDGYVEYVLNGRSRGGNAALAGWDIASAIRAALAVGQLDYARGLASALIQRRAAWDGKGAATRLARGSLLWALGDLRDRAGLTPEQQRLASSLVRDLIAAQHKSGAWLETVTAEGGDAVICTQTTAYAVLGLSRWSAGAEAAAQGRAWLTNAAVTDKQFYVGGRIWATTYTRAGRPENDFNSMIQSEAMLALATGVR